MIRWVRQYGMSRLATKQALIAVGIAFTIGIAADVIKIQRDIDSERTRIENIGVSITRTVLDSASRIAFRLDEQAALDEVRGILANEGVVSALIEDNFGDVLALETRDYSRSDYAPLSWLVGTELLTTDAPLTLGESGSIYGKLEITVDPQLSASDFSERTMRTIVYGLAKSFLLSIALMLAFYLTTTKRIEGLAQKFGKELEGKGDELKQLESSIMDWAEDKEALLNEATLNLRRIDLAEQAGDFGLWEWRPGENILIWDKGMHAIYGTKPGDEKAGFELWKSFLHPEDRDRAVNELQAAMADQKNFESKFRIVRKSGEIVSIHADAVCLFGETGEIETVVGININITEQELDREKLELANRRQAISEIAAGVAHDFNNILAIIMGKAELMIDDMELSSRHKDLEDILDASLRGSELTKRLLSFARQSDLRSVELNLNEVIRGMDYLIRHSIPENIDCQIELYEDLSNVKVDRGLLGNAILNLVLNAKDAMPEGGILSIKTSNITIDDGYIDDADGPIPLGSYVMLTVADTGTGIPPETLKKIFDPFFTTKTPDKGSGLGLPSVEGFVKQSSGTLRVYSELSRGTCFKILLPSIVNSSRSINVEQNDSIAITVRRAATILFAEDEPQVRETTKKSLEAMGHTVFAAANAAEALQRFKNASVKIDLVISDFIMPGQLNGSDLICEIRKIRAGIPAILMSGYPETITTGQDRGSLFDAVLMKPVPKKELLETVNRLLNSVAINE